MFKVIKNVIEDRLVNYFNKHTVTAMVDLMKDNDEPLENRDKIVANFRDLSKAIDTLSHEVLVGLCQIYP